MGITGCFTRRWCVRASRMGCADRHGAASLPGSTLARPRPRPEEAPFVEQASDPRWVSVTTRTLWSEHWLPSGMRFIAACVSDRQGLAPWDANRFDSLLRTCRRRPRAVVCLSGPRQRTGVESSDCPRRGRGGVGLQTSVRRVLLLQERTVYDAAGQEALPAVCCRSSRTARRARAGAVLSGVLSSRHDTVTPARVTPVLLATLPGINHAAAIASPRMPASSVPADGQYSPEPLIGILPERAIETERCSASVWYIIGSRIRTSASRHFHLVPPADA